MTQDAIVVSAAPSTARLAILLVTLGAAGATGAGVTKWRWWQSGCSAARPVAVVTLALTLGALVPIV